MSHHQQCLIVATLMLPEGETGVQTHFNQVMQAAGARGITTEVVHPHGKRGIVRLVNGVVVRALRFLDKGWLTLWGRWIDEKVIRHRLARKLEDVGFGAEPRVSIYAQDPVSLGAAVKAASGRARVVGVVHYNISEAYEYVLAGIGKEGSLVCGKAFSTERENLPLADTLLFCSEFMRRQVVSRVPALEMVPTAVIPNFCETPVGEPAIDVHGDIISIGTLEPRKNQGYLIRVLAQAHKFGHRYSMTLVGRGPSRQQFETLASELGVSDYVRFLGHVDQAARLISRHRVYAHAALMESFGIVLIEAFASGVPVLAPAVGGIPEILIDGSEGRFWPLDDERRAAEVLISMLEDDAQRQRMGRDAKDRCTACFSHEALSERWLSAIMCGSLAEKGADQLAGATLAEGNLP